MLAVCESLSSSEGKTGRFETNLSAIQHTTEENSRVSRPDEVPRREASDSEATQEGKKTNQRINGPKLRGFPKEYRLLKSAQFKEVYETGKKLINSEFVVYVSLERDDTRLGVAASRKIGSATVRNRLKRIVREVFRLNRKRILPETWVVVIPRRRARGIDYQRGEASILGLLKDGDALVD